MRQPPPPRPLLVELIRRWRPSGPRSWRSSSPRPHYTNSNRSGNSGRSPSPGSGPTTRTLNWAKRQASLVAGLAESRRTTTQRNHIMIRFAEWCTRHAIPQDTRTATWWVGTVANKASSRLAYLSAIVSRLHPRSYLQRFRTGLRRIAADQELSQALPATWEQVSRTMARLPRRDAAALFLTWKTASRCSEVERLTGRNVLEATPTSITIDWRNTTKTSTLQPYAPQLLTHILPRDDGSDKHEMTLLAEELQIGRTQLFCPNLRKAIAQLSLENPALGRHSLKSGALSRLFAIADQYQGQVALVALLAKHKQAVPPLPESTIRYGRDRLTLAKALGTGRVTKCL